MIFRKFLYAGREGGPSGPDKGGPEGMKDAINKIFDQVKGHIEQVIAGGGGINAVKAFLQEQLAPQLAQSIKDPKALQAVLDGLLQKAIDAGMIEG